MKKSNIAIIICACIVAIAMTITVFASGTASADYNEPTTISEAYIPSETSSTETPEEEEIIILELSIQ